MAHVKLRILVILVLLLTALTAHTSFAQQSGQPTEAQSRMQRCSLAQNYLKNIQKPRDLRARVDRLQAYRYIYQRLDLFVSRLERNNQPEAETLRASITTLDRTIDNFKNDYEQYDKTREEVVNVKDCKANMTIFESKLETTRAKRAQVNEDVKIIQNLLTPTVKDQLDVLHQQLLATGKSGEPSE